MSWNVSDNDFVTHPEIFQAIVRMAMADVLLFDEVSPSANTDLLRTVLDDEDTGSSGGWHINFGQSGGRQRGVIASRMALEALPEFSFNVPYPDSERVHILQAMTPRDRSNPSWSMDGGIPVNGAIVLAGSHRLLVVVADLQCCGNDPGSWQENRRRVEAREIRRLVRKVLGRTTVDGLLIAGDFNLVSTPIPMVILSGPYEPAHPGLIAAEIFHADGSATWTWDGRGSPYPSSALDYQMYGPQALRMQRGHILDSEDMTSNELEQSGLEIKSSSLMSKHRPLVVEYRWH